LKAYIYAAYPGEQYLCWDEHCRMLWKEKLIKKLKK
jgi:hypothetical protein